MNDASHFLDMWAPIIGWGMACFIYGVVPYFARKHEVWKWQKERKEWAEQHKKEQIEIRRRHGIKTREEQCGSLSFSSSEEGALSYGENSGALSEAERGN